MKLSHLTRHAIAASMLLAFALPASAAVITGADYAGASLSLQDGDIISGSFTNIGSFIIPTAATIYIAGGSPLSVSAQRIDISGILNGRGAGYAGGANGRDGASGTGPGAGAGGMFGNGVHASGGGGGGHAGAGGFGGSSFGHSPGIAPGGAANAAAMGSGGGGAGNHYAGGTGGAGGAGGAGITLNALNALFLTGSILADGTNGHQGITSDYAASGGGGGAGGTVNLSGMLFLDGLIDASGGNGASFVGQSAYGSAYGNGGGGGGGGSVLLSGMADFGSNFSIDVSGGAAGASLNLDSDTPRGYAVNAAAGSAGLLVDNTQPMADVPEPGSLALLALGLIGVASVRRKSVK